jgi:hypothetical protein
MFFSRLCSQQQSWIICRNAQRLSAREQGNGDMGGLGASALSVKKNNQGMGSTLYGSEQRNREIFCEKHDGAYRLAMISVLGVLSNRPSRSIHIM